MDPLAGRIAGHLDALCRYPDRHPGRRGNRDATELFVREATAAGLEVETVELDCLDWAPGPAELTVAAETYEVQSGPYANGAEVVAPLETASSVEELETRDSRHRILLLHGELCREQLTPKGYPFYEMPGHARIVAAIESAEPAAVLAATGRNPELAGAAYPFPLICDGAFEIPTAYLTDVDGERLMRHRGEAVAFRMESQRIAGTLQHVVATRRAAGGEGRRRAVALGHIDSVAGAPGALDNATGVAALLGLAELLRDYDGPLAVELVPLNGEDYYGATGERRWVADNEGRWDEIAIGLNADGAGWTGHGTEVSTYCCPEPLERAVAACVGRRSGFALGEQWYQSDQSLFLAHGVPAVAVTSADFGELCATVTHTERDVPALVDPVKVAEVARLYLDLIRAAG